MTLCPRLEFLASLIGPSPVFADIGSDHGLLPCFILSEGKAEKAVITDISPKSLQKAEKLIKRRGLADRAVFYQTDGFEGIKEEIYTAAIAGMGGMEIISILEKMPQSVKILLLQPMKNADKLRLYLLNRGFFIQTDKKVFSGGKYYDIIKVDTNNGSEVLSDFDIMFGKTNIEEKGQVFCGFLINEKQRLEKIGKKNAGSADRLDKTVYLLKNLYNI